MYSADTCDSEPISINRVCYESDEEFYLSLIDRKLNLMVVENLGVCHPFLLTDQELKITVKCGVSQPAFWHV